MRCAVIITELHLEQLPNNEEDLLTVGAIHARDVHSVRNDVASMIFPSAIAPPTEAMISAVTSKLITVVSDIEARLQRHDASAPSLPRTWPLLAKSGFLRETDLIDFMMARVAEDRMETKIIGSAQQLPAQLLNHADPNIADAAQALLAADTLHRRARGFTYQALRPELLHQLCWRLVAAIEVGSGGRDKAVIASARELLSDYDESRTAQAAARKLTHFLGDDLHADLIDPNKAGLQLYVAYLANKLEIEQDHVLHLIDIATSAPLSIILRAIGNTAEQAIAIIYLFKGFSLTPRDIALFERGFERLEQNAAKAEVRRWAHERAQYLMFPQTVRVST